MIDVTEFEPYNDFIVIKIRIIMSPTTCEWQYQESLLGFRDRKK